MNFGEALEALKRGDTVRRRHWVKSSANVAFVRLVEATDTTHAHCVWWMTDGRVMPMTYSHTNVLAEDWEVVDVAG